MCVYIFSSDFLSMIVYIRISARNRNPIPTPIVFGARRVSSIEKGRDDTFSMFANFCGARIAHAGVITCFEKGTIGRKLPSRRRSLKKSRLHLPTTKDSHKRPCSENSHRENPHVVYIVRILSFAVVLSSSDAAGLTQQAENERFSHLTLISICEHSKKKKHLYPTYDEGSCSSSRLSFRKHLIYINFIPRPDAGRRLNTRPYSLV